MTVPRVAVVGGGLAGLVAAARLAEFGVHVTLFERAASVGGVVQTVRMDGWTIDTGPCMAAEPDATVRGLLDRTGVTAATVRALPASAERYVVRNGSPVVLPRTSAGFAQSSFLSLAGRLRLIKERLIPAAPVDEETVDAFARRRFGNEAAERIFDPILASRSAGRSDQVLARYAFPAEVAHERGGTSGLQGSARDRMQARRKSRGAPAGSWSCNDGMHQAAALLAKSIADVRVATAVQRVRFLPAAVELTAGGRIEHVDAVVLALPAPAYGEVDWGDADHGALLPVATLPSASIVSVSLGFAVGQGPLPLDGARLLIPAVERRMALSLVMPTAAFPDRSPDGQLLCSAFLGGARMPELVDQSDAELIAIARTEVSDLLSINGAETRAHVTRWDGVLPQAMAGHSSRLAAADAFEMRQPRCVLAGAWRDGLSIVEVLQGGMRAVERLAAKREWGSA